MTCHKASRGFSIAGLAILSLMLGSVSAEACKVSLSRGWSKGGGTGTLVMQAGGKDCGGTLYTRRSQPATSAKVVKAPKNGRVATSGGSFAFTPNAGFRGQDSFSISGGGSGIGLSGTVSVTVQ